jgi:hypothetical protein
LPLSQLLVQGRVLLQLVRSWWPTEPQQQQQDPDQRRSSPGAHLADLADAAETSTTAAAEAGQPGHPAAAAAGAAAAAAAAAISVLQPLWSVTLQQWVTVGLLPQLLAVLNGSSRDLLQQDLRER